MKLLHIQHQLYNRPLLITPEGWNVINSVVQNKLQGKKPSFVDRLLGKDAEFIIDDKDDDDEECFYVENKVAYLSVVGPIGKKLGLLARMCGATDIDELRDNIDAAMGDPDIENIVFDVDSPGGSVDGVPELAEYIAEIAKKKKCIAMVDGMCCSAAMYLMSGVDEIYAVGKTSYIGSVGVYCYYLDESRAYQNAGLEPVLIKAGKNKGELLPGMPITEETKAHLQEEVDYIYDLFIKHMNKTRPQIKFDDMQGLAYYAEDAMEKGFIDGYLASRNQIKGLFI